MSTADAERVHTTPARAVDRAGAFASTLCAVHCATAAFVPAALGALGLGALLGHEAEWVFTIVAILFAGGALTSNLVRRRSRLVVGLLALGIVGLLASRAIESTSSHGHDEHVESAEAGHDHGHHDEAHGEEHGEGFDAHLVGTIIGVLAGVLLVSGHVLSLKGDRFSS